MLEFDSRIWVTVDVAGREPLSAGPRSVTFGRKRLGQRSAGGRLSGKATPKTSRAANMASRNRVRPELRPARLLEASQPEQAHDRFRVHYLAALHAIDSIPPGQAFQLEALVLVGPEAILAGGPEIGRQV